VLSLLRARAMRVAPSLASSLPIAAVLVAHPEEAMRAEARVLDDPTLRPAARTDVLLRGVGALLGGLRFLLGQGRGLSASRRRPKKKVRTRDGLLPDGIGIYGAGDPLSS